MSHGPALLAYALLTVALTWPLALGLGSLVPNDLGDPVLTMWTLWWNATVTPFTARWWDGLAFYPARNTLTLSDHRVGLGVIATPVILLGGSPLTAHNLVFLLSFFLSAAAAYALCLSITKNRAAAFVGGLIFGFNPFRAHHLSHLELLSSYWLPVVLLGLHKWAATLRGPWLLLAAAALLMQALTSGYYFMFAGTLLAFWVIWFMPTGLHADQYVRLALTLAAPLAMIAPVLRKYQEAHAAMGLSRSLQEIEYYSADVIGLLTAPPQLALWNSPEAWQRPEGALFPGVTAVALIAVGLWVRRTGGEALPPPRLWISRLRVVALTGAVAMFLIALIPTISGPVAREIAGIRISVTDAYKPLSVATLLFGFWVLSSSRMRQAWRDRSPFAFYVLATLAMWLFAFGPTARLLGERVLYKAPYSWLMFLPGFRDGFRVPARFGMLAILTLSVAAALALCRLLRGRSTTTQLAAACVVSAAVLTESWIKPLTTLSPPGPLSIPTAVPADAVILELPLGLMEDAAAMYRSISHRRRTVNGMSGYDAPHHAVLRAALDEGRIEVLDKLAEYGSVAIFVPRDAEGAKLFALLPTRTSARPIAVTETHDVLLLPRVPRSGSAIPRDQQTIPVQHLASNSNQQDLPLMKDGERTTGWMSDGPQRGVEQFSADLGQVVDISGIMLVQGRQEFPRAVAVDVSTDGGTWTEVWQGDTTAKTFVAAIEDPANIRLYLPFATTPGRHVRVRQLGQSQLPWVVGEFSVLAPER